MPDVITCTSEGDDPSGRRRQGVNRPDDAPAGRLKGASLVPGLVEMATRKGPLWPRRDERYCRGTSCGARDAWLRVAVLSR